MTNINLLRFPISLDGKQRLLGYSNARIKALQQSEPIPAGSPHAYRLGYYADHGAVVYCIDVEARGIQTFQDTLLKEYPELNSTYTEPSRNGGLHVFFLFAGYSKEVAPIKFVSKKDENNKILWEVKSDSIASSLSISELTELNIWEAEERLFNLLTLISIKKPSRKDFKDSNLLDLYADEFRSLASDIIYHRFQALDHESLVIKCQRLADCNAEYLVEQSILDYSDKKHETTNSKYFIKRRSDNLAPIIAVIKDLDPDFFSDFYKDKSDDYRKNESVSTSNSQIDSDTNRAIKALLKRAPNEIADRFPARYDNEAVIFYFDKYSYWIKPILKEESAVFFTRKNGSSYNAIHQIRETGLAWIQALPVVSSLTEDPSLPTGTYKEGALIVGVPFALPTSIKGNIPLTVEYLKDILGNGAERQYNVLLSWLKKLLFYPFDRSYQPKALFLRGDYRTGKSFLHETLLSKVLGNFYASVTPDDLRETGFNAHFVGKLLLASDEIKDLNSANSQDFFKRITTQTSQKKNEKFKAIVNVKNYSLYLFTYNLNIDVPRFVESESNRHIFLSVNPVMGTKKENERRAYFKALNDEINSPDWLPAFLDLVSQADVDLYLDVDLTRSLDPEQESASFFKGWEGAIREWVLSDLEGIVNSEQKVINSMARISATRLFNSFNLWYIAERPNETPLNLSNWGNIFKPEIEKVGAYSKRFESGKDYFIPLDFFARLSEVPTWKRTFSSIAPKEFISDRVAV